MISTTPERAMARTIQKYRDGAFLVMIHDRIPTKRGALFPRSVAPPAEVWSTAMLYSPISPAKKAPPRAARRRVGLSILRTPAPEKNRNGQRIADAKKTR